MLRLLIVEDDAETRTWIQQSIDDSQYSIAAAGNGETARELFTNADVVLLDVELPDSDGFELCKQLRRMGAGRPLQVVLLAQRGRHDRVARSLEVGADDFIQLPVSAHEFSLRVKAAEIRYANQARLLDERDYFRRAVKQEEELASRVLDQNLDLRRELDELRLIARIDSLSGLLNRGSLFSVLDAEIERAVRTDSSLTGIMIDIDHFKSVNDNHGHQAGDKVIGRIGELLQRQLRRYDAAGRYGGEEFFVVLADADDQQAFQFAHRLQEELRSRPITTEPAEISVTVSMGISEYRTGESRDLWIARADKAMYIAKQRGRNRIEVGSEHPPAQPDHGGT